MALFLLSGAAGLIYELVWTRELTFVFGGTTYAITTVLVCYMAGLGIGCYVSGRLCHRIARPGRTYGLVEIGIGLYALTVPALLGLAEPVYRAVYPRVAEAPSLLTAARFLLSAAVLILPTTAMGATLPLLVHAFARAGRPPGRSVGQLYGINTLGAVLGTMAAGFLLIPTLGLASATHVAAAANLAVGAAAIYLFRSGGMGGERAGAVAASTRAAARPVTELQDESHSPSACRSVLVVFAVSGFASMVYQIAWTRALVMSLGSTTYAFTCILTAFILGLALGSLAAARFVDRGRRHAAVLGVIQLGIGLSAVAIAPLYGRIPATVHGIVRVHADRLDTILALEFAMVIALTVVPTFLMGAAFPLVTRAIAAGREDAAAATGRAYAVNTIGTILGAFLAGFVFIRSDVLGAQYSIFLAAALNALAGAWLLVRVQPIGPPAGRWIAAGALALVPLFAVASGGWDQQALTSAPFLGKVRAEDGRLVHRVLMYRDGVDLTVAVTAWPSERPGEVDLSLSVNGKADASTSHDDMVTQIMIGHVGALFDAQGERACVVGLGSGMTVSALTRHPTYGRIDCVELSDDVIAAAEYFLPYTHNVLNDARVNILRADGRNHLLLSPDVYDLIVSEPSNPWIAGVANLFTVEYFQLARRRLAEDGCFCLWLQGYCTSLRDFQSVVRSIFEVFDDVSVWELAAETDYLFLMRRQRGRTPLDVPLKRFAAEAVREDLYRVGFSRLEQILGRYITSGEPLRQWSRGAPLNTDDNARLEFSAPRNLYRSEGVSIAASLYALRRSIFDEWLEADPSRAEHTVLVERVDAVVRSRQARLKSYEHWENDDPVAALALLLEAYELNPGSYDIYDNLLEFRKAALRDREFITSWGTLQPMLERIDTLRMPFISDPRGTPLAAVVEALVEQARRAGQLGAHDAAASYLEEARWLSPQRGDLVIALAETRIAQSRAPQALDLLEAWLAEHPDDTEAASLRQKARETMDVIDR